MNNNKLSARRVNPAGYQLAREQAVTFAKMAMVEMTEDQIASLNDRWNLMCELRGWLPASHAKETPDR